MHEFSAYINHCAQQFVNIAKCQNCPYGQCIHEFPNSQHLDCYSCLSKIHRKANQGMWTYMCQKITYNYILKHGHRYASEIDQILKLLKNTQGVQLPLDLNVASIGCGPCTELFGILNQFSANTVHYKGFDMNPIWKPLITFERALFPNKDIQFYNQDFFVFMAGDDWHVDVLILNYMLSDMARCQTLAQCSAFVDSIINLCDSGRISYIVINDIYLTYLTGTGYALMEELARKLRNDRNVVEREWRGRFVEPNEWQPQYGTKWPDTLSFPIVEPSVVPYGPMNSCKSIFIVIETRTI